MTKNEMIQALADYFGVELKKNEDGTYDISGHAWQSGCSFGSIDRPWLTLSNVVDALSEYCDEEEDY